MCSQQMSHPLAKGSTLQGSTLQIPLSQLWGKAICFKVLAEGREKVLLLSSPPPPLNSTSALLYGSII